METSALQAYIKARRPRFDQAEYQAALEADWQAGRPEQIAEYDCRMGLSGGVIRSADSFVGYVGTMRFDGTQLSEYRSIPRGNGSTWREVFARDVDGQVWHVGKIRRRQKAYGVPGPAPRFDLPLDTEAVAFPPRGS